MNTKRIKTDLEKQENRALMGEVTNLMIVCEPRRVQAAAAAGVLHTTRDCR
jgi:hypothetical protein